MKTIPCKQCGTPLILRENDNPADPVHEESEYEDGNNGLCGNCLCGDRISRQAMSILAATEGLLRDHLRRALWENTNR
jgi:hypothetical protein